MSQTDQEYIADALQRSLPYFRRMKPDILDEVTEIAMHSVTADGKEFCLLIAHEVAGDAKGKAIAYLPMHLLDCFNSEVVKAMAQEGVQAKPPKRLNTAH